MGQTLSISLDVVTRLSRYRLAHDLTFSQLADAMRAAGYPVKSRLLQVALTGRCAQPWDRTLYKFEQFLKRVEPETPEASV